MSNSHALNHLGVLMSLLEPLALRLEDFVYNRVCAIAGWSDRDGERGVRTDALASTDEGALGARPRW